MPQVPQEALVQLDLQEVLDRLVIQVLQALQGLQEPILRYLVQQDQRVLQALQAPLEIQEPLVLREPLDLPVQRVQLEIQEPQDLLVLQGLLVLPDQLVQQVQTSQDLILRLVQPTHWLSVIRISWLQQAMLQLLPSQSHHQSLVLTTKYTWLSMEQVR